MFLIWSPSAGLAPRSCPLNCYFRRDICLLDVYLSNSLLNRLHAFCSFVTAIFPLSLNIHILRTYTGKSAFLRALPTLSNACCIYGPITGIFPAKEPTVAKKSPNSTNIPYSSTRNPIRGHLKRIRTMPTANAAVPLIFCRRAKNRAVFWSPMIKVSPSRKRICNKGRYNRLVLGEKE